MSNHLVMRQLYESETESQFTRLERIVQRTTVETLNEFLLKKVSMKMPSFPIRSWSASSKSSLATKSSSCTNTKKYVNTLQNLFVRTG